MDVQAAVAKPQFADEGHIPIHEWIIEEIHSAVRAHVRIQSPELLGHIVRQLPQLSHGRPAQGIFDVIDLPRPEEGSGHDHRGKQSLPADSPEIQYTRHELRSEGRKLYEHGRVKYGQTLEGD